MRNICDRTLIADYILRASILEMLVEDAIQPASLVLVAVDPVLDMFRCLVRLRSGIAFPRSDCERNSRSV